MGIKVLTTPMEASEEALATFSEPRNFSISKLTICLWTFNFFQQDTWFLQETSNKGFRISMTSFGNYFKIGSLSYRYPFPDDFEWLPDTWMFICFSYDNIAKEFKIYLNGDKIFENKEARELDGYKISEDFLQHLSLGHGKRFRGRLTKFNMWSRILSYTDIIVAYNCQESLLQPDIVNWENVKLEASPDLILEEVEHIEDLCKKAEDQTYVFKDHAQMGLEKKAVRVCRSLSGRMKEPSNEKEWNMLVDNLRPYFETCPKNAFWVPIYKQDHNLKWIDQNLERAEFTPWENGQPNGGDDNEGCAIFWIGDEWKYLYWDTKCDRQFCYYCKLKTLKKFYLKGFCPSNLVDFEFVFKPASLIGGKPFWKGFTGSTIEWKDDLKTWNLINNKTTIASLNISSNFPSGLYKWTLSDQDFCPDLQGNKLSLMLSSCGFKDFPCSDGSCIPMEKKCDYIEDCWDGSDEDNCTILDQNLMGEKYYPDLPHIRVNSKNQIEPSSVKISIEIIKITRIKEV